MWYLILVYCASVLHLVYRIQWVYILRIREHYHKSKPPNIINLYVSKFADCLVRIKSDISFFLTFVDGIYTLISCVCSNEKCVFLNNPKKRKSSEQKWEHSSKTMNEKYASSIAFKFALSALCKHEHFWKKCAWLSMRRITSNCFCHRCIVRTTFFLLLSPPPSIMHLRLYRVSILFCSNSIDCN